MSTGQKWLAAGVIGLGAALMPLAFIVMLLTVNRLLWPYLGDWAWSVPIGTELGFTGLFLLDLLLEWKQRPNPWLRLPPYAFAAISLWLNIAAAHGSVPAAVGHAVLPLVFFGYLLAGKAALRSLSVSEGDRARRIARADVTAHARDILRAELGPAWRWRTPVLLRRQIRAGRLPAAVTAAIDSGLGYGGATVWEPVVQQWVTSSLTQRDKVKASVAQQRRAIARTADETASGTPGGTSGETSVAQSRRPSQRDSKRDKARRLIRDNPAISAGDLGQKVGVPRSTAARWKTAETRPRLVAGEG